MLVDCVLHLLRVPCWLGEGTSEVNRWYGPGLRIFDCHRNLLRCHWGQLFGGICRKGLVVFRCLVVEVQRKRDKSTGWVCCAPSVRKEPATSSKLANVPVHVESSAIVHRCKWKLGWNRCQSTSTNIGIGKIIRSDRAGDLEKQLCTTTILLTNITQVNLQYQSPCFWFTRWQAHLRWRSNSDKRMSCRSFVFLGSSLDRADDKAGGESRHHPRRKTVAQFTLNNCDIQW